MHFLARFSLGHRVLTALITVAIAVLGVVNLTGLRQELIPSVSFPVAAVVGVYPGASPEMVENQITEAVETASLGVSGATKVSSTSSANVSITTVTFAYGTDLDQAVSDLQGGIDRVAIPEGVEPEVFTGSVDDLPVVQLAVSGGTDQATLQTAVDDILVPELEDLADVKSVSVTGAPAAQVELRVDLPAMATAGVSPEAVLNVLKDNGIRMPAGTITDGDQTIAVQVGTPITDLEQLKALPLPTAMGATVPLSQVATVVDGQEAATSISRLNGEPSLGIALTKTPDGNVVEISHAVADALETLTDRLDAQQVEVAVVFDQAPYISRSILDLAEEGGLGLAFAVLVILLFLMSWRSTAVSALSIPLSLLVAFTVMRLTGYTLNILTLAALTIAIGRVVDDSIVVIENISRHLSYGEERGAAIRTAVQEVAGAITSATLATVAVFAPIGFVNGFVGELFRPFALTVVIAMLASLFVALTIVPVLAFWFLRTPTNGRDAEEVRAAAEQKERAGLWQRSYLPVLGFAIRRPVVSLLVAIAVLGGTGALVPYLETNMFGDSGQNSISVTQTFKPGTSLTAQDAEVRKVEDALLAIDAVETVETSFGTPTGEQAYASRGTQALFSVTLDPDADVPAVTNTVNSALKDLVKAPVTDIATAGAETGFNSSTVDLIITADDPDVLNEAAELVEASAGEAQDVEDVTSSRTADQPVFQTTVDRAAASAAGLTEQAVSQAMIAAMNDLDIGSVDLGDGPVTVTAHFADAPTTVEALRTAPITTPTGPVLLDQVADIELVNAPATITRLDGHRTVTVSVTPSGDDLGALTTDLTTRMADLDLPDGATVTVGGAAAEQAEAFGDMGLAMIVAILVVFIVLVATLNSIGQALILLVSIPFAATGALLGLLATGTPLGVPALVGLLMLVGIVVSNAIVLIDLVNQYRAKGYSVADAVTEGARQRLRPIVMTAAATIFALAPMAIGITGGGGFIAQPLAIVVIGGLVTSTLLTLVVVPVLYVLSQRRAERRAQRRHDAPSAEPDNNGVSAAMDTATASL